MLRSWAVGKKRHSKQGQHSCTTGLPRTRARRPHHVERSCGTVSELTLQSPSGTPWRSSVSVLKVLSCASTQRQIQSRTLKANVGRSNKKPGKKIGWMNSDGIAIYVNRASPAPEKRTRFRTVLRMPSFVWNPTRWQRWHGHKKSLGITKNCRICSDHTCRPGACCCKAGHGTDSPSNTGHRWPRAMPSGCRRSTRWKTNSNQMFSHLAKCIPARFNGLRTTPSRRQRPRRPGAWVAVGSR